MYKKSNLENGLRVVTHDIKDRESVSLGFWVGVGGRYEDDRLKGAAHFLEHILFKGTKKYGCEEIKQLIEGVGGTLNAFTSEEQTCYYAKIPAQHLNQTFDVLADMVFYPKINQKDVAKEGPVIIEEIKMYHDLPQYHVLENLDMLMWPNHPLGKSLAGTPETVAKMTSQDLRDFHRAHYVTGNVVVSACGKITHEQMVRLTQKVIGKVPPGGGHSYIKADNSQIKPRVNLYRKEIEQMHVALGMFGYDERNMDRYVLSLMSILLGGNMSSRLFVEIREKRGLAYSVSTSSKSMHDTGLFMVRAGVENNQVVDSLELILKELHKISRQTVPDEEFKRTRDYLFGQLQLSLEDTMEHMLWVGEAVVSKDSIKTFEQVIRDFNKITPADIKRVAKEILNPNRYNLSIVGPLKDDQKKRLNQLMDF